MSAVCSEERIAERLAGLPGWEREPDNGKWIVRVYRFREFMAGIGFVNEVARLSEALNHHPLIYVEFKKVTLRLTSWRAGGLTELDFQTAEAFERARSGMG